MEEMRRVEELEAKVVGNAEYTKNVREEDEEWEAELEIMEEHNNKENDVGLQLIRFQKDR